MAKISLKVGGGGGKPLLAPMPRPDTTNVIPAFGSTPLFNPGSSAPTPKEQEALIKLIDKRVINPATGQPYKTKGAKGISANADSVKAIIAHAKAKGVDPRTALAIALQETNIGQLDPNFGSAWATFEDEGLPDDRNKNANILAKAIKDKMAYANELRRKGLLPQGEEYDLQTYNGLGILKPTATVGGVVQNQSYYGIPVTAQRPLNLKKNPAYGKIVRQLRDEVIGNNPEILKLIESTPAYGQQAVSPAASNAQKVVLQVRK